MANSVAHITAVALDFDGVISSLDIDWKAAIHQASNIAGYDIRSLLLFYKEKFGTPIFERVSTEMEKLELAAVKKAQLQPCTKKALADLAQRGLDLYVVSMQTSTVIKEFLVHQGIADCFKDIVTREKYPSKKAQVEYVLKKYHIYPNSLLLIDDSKQNIVSCSQLGIACFHFQSKTGFLCSQDNAKEAWSKVLVDIENPRS